MLGRCRVLFRPGWCLVALSLPLRVLSLSLFRRTTFGYIPSSIKSILFLSFVCPSTTWSTAIINPQVNEWYGLFDRCLPARRRVDVDGCYLGSSFICLFFPLFLMLLWHIGNSFSFRLCVAKSVPGFALRWEYLRYCSYTLASRESYCHSLFILFSSSSFLHLNQQTPNIILPIHPFLIVQNPTTFFQSQYQYQFSLSSRSHRPGKYVPRKSKRNHLWSFDLCWAVDGWWKQRGKWKARWNLS